MIVLPAHVPVFPEAGVFAGNVLVTPGATETVPFTGNFVMLTVTGSALQLRSHARSCVMRVSTPDSTDRVRVSSWAHQRGDQATKRNSQRSHLSPRFNRHFPYPKSIALVMRPKNLCDIVTLLEIGE